MKHIASAALVVGLGALPGCRGEVLLGSEPPPDGSAPSSSGLTMSSSGGSSSGGSAPQPNGSTPSSSGLTMSNGGGSSSGGSAPQPDGSTPSGSGLTMSNSGGPSSDGSAPQPDGSTPSICVLPIVSSSGDSSSAPTWTQIYIDYLQAGTLGNCAASGCHYYQMNSAQSAYAYLKAYINGSCSVLVETGGSCLSWYGGNMPPGGPRSVPMAVADMNAWVAAGAMDN